MRVSKFLNVNVKKWREIKFPKAQINNHRPSVSLGPGTVSPFLDDGSPPVTARATGVVRTLDPGDTLVFSQAVATVEESKWRSQHRHINKSQIVNKQNKPTFYKALLEKPVKLNCHNDTVTKINKQTKNR